MSALEVVLSKTVIGSLPVCMVTVLVVFWPATMLAIVVVGIVVVLSINSLFVVRAKKIKY